MPRWSRWIDSFRRRADLADDGSAALEFIFVGMLLLVPIVYLVIALGAVQHASLGAESGARHIARAISTASDAGDADARAERVLASVAREYDLASDAVGVEVACTGTTAACPQAGATVVVTLRTTVELPLVPPVFGLERLAQIPVEASAVQKVSRFWGSG
jgi:Flp pilus assembly protein TadG